jgi:hypothetical protein
VGINDEYPMSNDQHSMSKGENKTDRRYDLEE